MTRAADVFGGAKTPKTPDLKNLYVKIGQSGMEKDFFEEALIKASLLRDGRDAGVAQGME